MRNNTGWVPLQVIANFNKLKKLAKDVRAIAAALESSEQLVVERKGGKHYRVRRKVGVVKFILLFACFFWSSRNLKNEKTASNYMVVFSAF